MKIENILSSPILDKYSLVKTIEWYGHRMTQIFTTPLPKGPFSTALEKIARVVTFLVLAVLSVSLIVIAPFALAEWAIQRYFSPISQSLALDTPKKNEPKPFPSSIPYTTVEAARNQAEELTRLYNELKELNGATVQSLLTKIDSFRTLYERYRNSDPFIIDEMTKIFNTVDEIFHNVSSMHALWQYWFHFYQIQADSQGIIPQPKDGNCWLHASILGLQLIHHSDLGNNTHETLRANVVDWMRANHNAEATLKRFITDAIETHQAFERNRLQEEINNLQGIINMGFIPPQDLPQAQNTLKELKNSLKNLQNFTLEDYFVHMAKIGSHGTHAELYTISRLFKVNIAIWRDIPAWGDHPNHLTNEYDEQIQYPGAEHTINVVLTQEGNHFNYRLPQNEQKQPSEEKTSP